MMRLKAIIQCLLLSIGVSMVALPAIAAAAPSHATPTQPLSSIRLTAKKKSANTCHGGSFFGLIPWYGYLQTYTDATGECAVCFSVTNTSNFDTADCTKSKTSSIPLVLLAIVDDMLRITGMITIGYIIYGAIQYITSQGNPDATAKAQGTIVNALIGLAIASVAVGFVSFVGSKLGG